MAGANFIRLPEVLYNYEIHTSNFSHHAQKKRWACQGANRFEQRIFFSTPSFRNGQRITCGEDSIHRPFKEATSQAPKDVRALLKTVEQKVFQGIGILIRIPIKKGLCEITQPFFYIRWDNSSFVLKGFPIGQKCSQPLIRQGVLHQLHDGGVWQSNHVRTDQTGFNDMHGMSHRCHQNFSRKAVVVEDGPHLVHAFHAGLPQSIKSTHKRRNIGCPSLAASNACDGEKPV